MAKEWDKENMRTLATNMKREYAEAFREYAEANGTTPGALLRGFVESTVTPGAKAGDAFPKGVLHLVSYKNTDLLKAETAHHNPGNLNPSGMLNYILDE